MSLPIMSARDEDDFTDEIAGEQLVLPVAIRGGPTFAPHASASKPLLSGPQELHRISPQPDRLVVVKAADVPLIEAARPLLDALARVAEHLTARKVGAEEVDTLHRQLLEKVVSFLSVCQDAGIGNPHILGASYMLCSALDEAVAIALCGGGEKPDLQAWAVQPLSVHFHGDNRGGKNVFVLLGWLVARPAEQIDLLELMLYLLALGFQGIYRHAAGGRRELESIRRRVHNVVSACRGEPTSARLQHIEELLREL